MPDLRKYVQLIKSGEIVAFPTETVYGLGADAWNPSAVQKIFEAKGRPSDNPLIVHVCDRKQLDDFTAHLPQDGLTLMQNFWPGPLTLILQKKDQVLDVITAGLDTVAIRMPDHNIALELIRQTGPLVAPSANKSGFPSPTRAEHVRNDFGQEFPVIDGAATKVGLESTVLDLTGDQPQILRPGSISRKSIEDVLGKQVHDSFFHSKEKPKSPGQKYSHYKPAAEVRWLDPDESPVNNKALYLMITPKESELFNIINYEGDIGQMARELYDRFRQADLDGYNAIIIERFEESKDEYSSIYSALLDRISKAIGN